MKPSIGFPLTRTTRRGTHVSGFRRLDTQRTEHSEPASILCVDAHLLVRQNGPVCFAAAAMNVLLGSPCVRALLLRFARHAMQHTPALFDILCDRGLPVPGLHWGVQVQRFLLGRLLRDDTSTMFKREMSLEDLVAHIRPGSVPGMGGSFTRVVVCVLRSLGLRVMVHAQATRPGTHASDADQDIVICCGDVFPGNFTMRDQQNMCDDGQWLLLGAGLHIALKGAYCGHVIAGVCGDMDYVYDSNDWDRCMIPWTTMEATKLRAWLMSKERFKLTDTPVHSVWMSAALAQALHDARDNDHDPVMHSLFENMTRAMLCCSDMAHV
jgi:hypothetical protein